MVILLNIILDKYYSMLSNIQQIINYRSTCLIKHSHMHAVLRLSSTKMQKYLCYLKSIPEIPYKNAGIINQQTLYNSVFLIAIFPLSLTS